ncbi:unnamed protein product [Lactuca saligna]|uniref:Uncharacterized protein n=1 Tax=Lactuca saligna TaxID=75948 RepID=A0AA36EC06_LACSI|nr:unnamed protein product [Lactuca saligna]
MASTPCLIPTGAEFDTLLEAYGLTPADGVEFPVPGSLITRPPAGKVGVYPKTFDAGLRLPLTNFQEEILRCCGCSVQMLTLDAIHKVVAFEMICRANGIIPDYFVFKYFFRFPATNDKYTFSARRGGHNLVLDNKPPKNYQEKWVWVNHELLGRDHPRAVMPFETIPKLFPHNQQLRISCVLFKWMLMLCRRLSLPELV